MTKIPFDIKFRPQIESGEYKAETEAGLPATVMDWEYNDKNKGKCIAVKITEGGTDSASLYTTEGKRASIFPMEGSNLILITPEPELSEFEKKLSDVVGYAISLSATEPKKPTSEFVKEYVSELLALARNELVKSGYAIIEGEHYLEEGRKNYERGKAEALKDLPRWVKVNKGDLLDKYSNYLLCSNEGYYYCSGNTITRDGYMLLVDNLEKLPKEE